MKEVDNYLSKIGFVARRLLGSRSLLILIGRDGLANASIVKGIAKGLKRRVKSKVVLIKEPFLPAINSEKWESLADSFDTILLFGRGPQGGSSLILTLEARSRGAFAIQVLPIEKKKDPGCDFAIMTGLPGVFPDVIGKIDQLTK